MRCADCGMMIAEGEEAKKKGSFLCPKCLEEQRQCEVENGCFMFVLLLVFVVFLGWLLMWGWSQSSNRHGQQIKEIIREAEEER